MNSSSSKFWFRLLFRHSGLAIALAYLLYMIFNNDVAVDIGDGILHYGYSEDSWEHHEHFLSHWAKPPFTLLSSPFAQVSYTVYLLFNVIIFFFTSLAAFAVFRKLKSASGYFFFFPLILLAVPDYTYCVLGGMTEPLFGMLLAVMLWLAVSEKWTWFAVVASFSLFSRSEGMLVVCLSFLMLIYNKAWKAIPFLTAGFIVYGIAGISVFGTFWWYFKNDPYTATGFYGSGPWNFYLVNYASYAGHIMRYLIPVACLGWFISFKRKDGQEKGIVLFAVSLFLLIIAIHSYLWFHGFKGSAGLTRLGTLGLVPFVIALLIGCNRFTKELHLLPLAVIFIFFSWYTAKKISLLPYPKQANANEQLIIQAAQFVKDNYSKRRVKYYHPMIGLTIGGKIINDPLVNVWSFNADTLALNKLGEGEIVIRDMMFGDGEAGLPMDFINSRKEMKVVKVFKAPAESHSLSTGKNEVIVYEIVRNQ